MKTKETQEQTALAVVSSTPLSAVAPIEALGKLEQAGALAAKSGFFGQITPSTGAMVLMTMYKENLSPVEFKRRYHVIGGTPSRTTNSLLADFKLSGGKYEILANDDEVCKMKFVAKDGTAATIEITMEKMLKTKHPYAQKSNYPAPDGKRFLKDNWAEHPDDMLFARCCAKGLRRVAPEIMGGVYATEEVDWEEAPKAAPIKLSPEDVKVRVSAIAKPEPAPEPAPAPAPAPVEPEVVEVEPEPAPAPAPAPSTAQSADPSDPEVCPVPGKLFGKRWDELPPDVLLAVFKMDRTAHPEVTAEHYAAIERTIIDKGI